MLPVAGIFGRDKLLRVNHAPLRHFAFEALSS